MQPARDQRFEIEIFVSPGGYILGEETALLEALEDKRGEPRNKPPYPGTHGLWGKPTLINNVETFALATSIVHFGSQWWHDQGCGECSGIKFFSISGDIARPGVYEIPMGTPVAELIKMAGGMKQNKSLKAFLPGGASSNFLTAGHVHTPLDFDAMKKAGSMLGTGAVIVICRRSRLVSDSPQIWCNFSVTNRAASVSHAALAASRLCSCSTMFNWAKHHQANWKS